LDAHWGHEPRIKSKSKSMIKIKNPLTG